MEKEQNISLTNLPNKQLKLLNKKKCSKCNNILNLSDFADKQAKCRSCRSAVVLEQYHANNQIINNITNNYIKVDTINDYSSVNVKNVSNTQIFNQSQLELNKDKLIQPINTPVKTSIYEKYISDVQAINLKRGRHIIELSKKNKPIHFEEYNFSYKCTTADLKIILIKINEYLLMIKYPDDGSNVIKSSYQITKEEVKRPKVTIFNFEEALHSECDSFPFMPTEDANQETLDKVLEGFNKISFEENLPDSFYEEYKNIYKEILEFIKYINIHNFNRDAYFKLGIETLTKWTDSFKKTHCNLEVDPIH